MQRRSLLLGSLGITASAVVSACSNGGSGSASVAVSDASDAFGYQETGLPITTKPLPLKFSGTKSALAPKYETMSLVQQWKKDTNIDITWDNLPETVYQEKKNLMLASGDLPDALFNTGLSDAEIVANGTNGTLIPLEGLIDTHAPNLKAIFDKRPDIKSAMTASDGHIYTLPAVEELGILPYPNFLYINKKWLDEAGLPVPTTMAELKAALVAFKKRGSNVIPLSFRTDSFCANPHDLIAAVGGVPDNNDHRIVQDDKVVFTAATDGWKAGVKELGQWYKEGLIDSESFSQDDAAYLAKGKATPQVLGAFFWWESKEAVGADRNDDYVLVGVLKGNDGTQRASVANNQEINRGAFAITRANKYPNATMRWVDRLYDPAMSAQTSWGPIGTTLEKDAQGILVQIPAKAGESEGERRQKVAPGGPKVTTAEDFEKVVAPEPRAKERQEICKKYFEPYKANDKFPPVLLSNEELEQVTDPVTDINTLVKEKFATWVVKGTIDSEWDAYVAKLKSIGIDEVTGVYQQAYDRFKSQQG
ncbi:extracellular solute-binding protein [Luteococcus sanguinis]|uniref:Extracellular solute-binding protein n=1 Tax=Luteococcus sanguinis TaxID=174038 RepID=A0ABW1X531_9ACTN